MLARILEESRRAEAIRIALTVIPMYFAAFPGDGSLLAAIASPDGVEAAETIMLAVGERAVGLEDRAAAHALHRAAYAAEAVWLALHPEPDLDEVIAAAEASMFNPLAVCVV